MLSDKNIADMRTDCSGPAEQQEQMCHISNALDIDIPEGEDCECTLPPGRLQEALAGFSKRIHFESLDAHQEHSPIAPTETLFDSAKSDNPRIQMMQTQVGGMQGRINSLERDNNALVEQLQAVQSTAQSNTTVPTVPTEAANTRSKTQSWGSWLTGSV